MQVVEDVAGARDELGALLDEAVRASGGRAVDLAGHGIDEPPVFERLAGGDERAAVQSGLDDEQPAAPAGDDAVAVGKGLRARAETSSGTR